MRSCCHIINLFQLAARATLTIIKQLKLPTFSLRSKPKTNSMPTHITAILVIMIGFLTDDAFALFHRWTTLFCKENSLWITIFFSRMHAQIQHYSGSTTAGHHCHCRLPESDQCCWCRFPRIQTQFSTSQNWNTWIVSVLGQLEIILTNDVDAINQLKTASSPNLRDSGSSQYGRVTKWIIAWFQWKIPSNFNNWVSR